MTLIRSNSCAFFRLLHLRPFVAHIKSKIKKAQKEAEKAEAVETPPQSAFQSEARAQAQIVS